MANNLNIASCANASYTSIMYQSQNDELALNDIFVSSNCKYAVRAERDELALYYLSSDIYHLESWYMYDSVWSIHPTTKQQTLILSNDGCLSWLIQQQNDTSSILEEYCDRGDNHLQTSFYTTQSSQADTTETDHSTNDLYIIIPITAAIIAIAFAVASLVLCLCKNKTKKHESPKEDNKNTDNEDITDKEDDLRLSDVDSANKNNNINLNKLISSDNLVRNCGIVSPVMEHRQNSVLSQSKVELGSNISVHNEIEIDTDNEESDDEVIEYNSSSVIVKVGSCPTSSSEDEIEIEIERILSDDGNKPTKADNNKQSRLGRLMVQMHK